MLAMQTVDIQNISCKVKVNLTNGIVYLWRSRFMAAKAHELQIQSWSQQSQKGTHPETSLAHGKHGKQVTLITNTINCTVDATQVHKCGPWNCPVSINLTEVCETVKCIELEMQNSFLFKYLNSNFDMFKETPPATTYRKSQLSLS